MPELPEVETVVRGLRKTVAGKSIKSVLCNSPKINNDNFKGWLNVLDNKCFESVNRRGKNILIKLSGGYTLWVHLKMTGHLYYLPESKKIDKHDLLIFNLKNSCYHLRFNDYRRFGRVRLVKSGEIKNQKGLIELGPEPLEISPDDFITLFKSRRRFIKSALLDQTFIAGLGNIYTDESLYQARIHPLRLTNSLSDKRLRELHIIIQKILGKAIRLMGTSVDSYAGVNGQPGGFQKYLLVYGRENEPCFRCATKIRRQKIGSRSAHFCPKCQRLK
jgi:formamidopyrimidine-DNA glycosylase